MSLFCPRKDLRVQNFVLKLLNNNCPGLRAVMEGPRIDRRVNMVLVVMIIPIENNRLQIGRAFTAVTKEFSNMGVSVVLDEPHELDQVVLGFRFEGDMHFIRATAKHLDPMGGGFHQLGLQMVEVVSGSNYPELESVDF